jgi:hypothetical protein
LIGFVGFHEAFFVWTERNSKFEELTVVMQTTILIWRGSRFIATLFLVGSGVPVVRVV